VPWPQKNHLHLTTLIERAERAEEVEGIGFPPLLLPMPHPTTTTTTSSMLHFTAITTTSLCAPLLLQQLLHLSALFHFNIEYYKNSWREARERRHLELLEEDLSFTTHLLRRHLQAKVSTRHKQDFTPEAPKIMGTAKDGGEAKKKKLPHFRGIEHRHEIRRGDWSTETTNIGAF